MVAGWPRFAATLALYRKALASVGNDDRACDQFGTLLTCADLLLYDELPSVEVLDEWAQACAPAQLTEIAQADAVKWAMLEEWSVTKRAPKHAAFLHAKELGNAV